MSEKAPAPELIEAAAAAWLSLRDRGMTAEETAGFVHWLQQDPRHAEVFDELARTWLDCDRLASVPAAPPPPGTAPDADLLAPRLRRRRFRVLPWSALAAAAAAVILLALATLVRNPRHAAETAVGGFEKVDLPDGSIAQLNTDSAIDLAFSGGERRVVLVRGEVHFTVARDPGRPFVVSAGPVTVRAVGTAFNVRQRDAAVEVLVTEGRVSLDDAALAPSHFSNAPAEAAAMSPILVAGDRALVPNRSAGAGGTVASLDKVSPSGLQRALAWQERRLEFESVPLSEVVGEFNRYNRRQLVIEDPALAAKRFSGTFRADGYESLVRLLETDFGVEIVRRENVLVLRRR